MGEGRYRRDSVWACCAGRGAFCASLGVGHDKLSMANSHRLFSEYCGNEDFTIAVSGLRKCDFALQTALAGLREKHTKDEIHVWIGERLEESKKLVEMPTSRIKDVHEFQREVDTWAVGTAIGLGMMGMKADKYLFSTADAGFTGEATNNGHCRNLYRYCGTASRLGGCRHSSRAGVAKWGSGACIDRAAVKNNAGAARGSGELFSGL